MPVQIAKRLNCSSTTRPIRAWTTRKTRPCVTLTWPDGIGRERVRSTFASRSRSVMSFQVQPAPRMAKAPMKNNAMSRGSGRSWCAWPAASATDHQHGIKSSQEPIGRSSRASLRYGRDQAGAVVSTQLPVESATRVAAPLTISPLENVAVQRVEGAAALLRRRRLGHGVRRAQHVAQRRTGRPRRLHLLGGVANLLQQILGALVPGLELVGDLRRDPALFGVLLDIVDHLDFGRRVIADHLAGFIRRRVALARGLDRLALLFRILAQRQKPLHARLRRTGCPRARR